MADRLIRSGRYYGDGDVYHLDGQPLPRRPLLEPLEAALYLRYRSYPGQGGAPTHPEVSAFTAESEGIRTSVRRVVRDVLRTVSRIRHRAR